MNLHHRLTIDMGADIFGSDGANLGTVDSTVMDPRTGDVLAIVVRKGLFFPTDKIIEAERITRIDDEGIHVDLDEKSAENLQEFVDIEHMVPPMGFYGEGNYMWPATEVYDATLMVDDAVEKRHPGSIMLSVGTRVIDIDDDDIGSIKELLTDERGRVTGLLVEEGFIRHHSRAIPAHFVSEATDGHVRLNIAKDELDHLIGPPD